MKAREAVAKLTYKWNYIAPLLDDAIDNLKPRFEAFIDRNDCENFSLRQIYAEVQEKFRSSGVQETAGTFHDAITGIKSIAFASDPGGSTELFDSIFERIYDGRRLFLTKKGYLGLGVEPVRKGDTVMLVAGADMPYVFCSLKEVPLSYTLVGEAYIHGVMHGEAIKDASFRFEAVKLV